MNARIRKYTLTVFATMLAALALPACAGPTRFALLPPVLRDSDDRLLQKAPAEDEESDYANSIDVILLQPLARSFLFEQPGEAHNVNSLDEVADSTWFTARSPAPAELTRGPCPDAGPVPPFTIKSSKAGGTTPGFQVKDSRGQRYMIKLDALARRQPEISTAADAIVSRLYWAIGFNAPCNDVVYIGPKDLLLDDKSTEKLPTGGKQPLTAARVAEVLAKGTTDAAGRVRFGASRFIDGEPVGTWRTEGTRADDPNDVIPHEDRRELRGERFLAAWVNHWDSRGPNTFDAFVKRPSGGGYVLHYFLDFSDSLGAVPMRTGFVEPRMGFVTVFDPPQIAADAVGLGFVRRPWDEVKLDPRYPNLGYLDVEHFDPMGFSPQTPLVRWARARPADLAWMARKIARLGAEHVRVALKAGKLSDAAEEARLHEILMGRREKILRRSFARVSPLADPRMDGNSRFCTVDLGIATGISKAESVKVTLELRRGANLALSHAGVRVEKGPAGRSCFVLPDSAAPASAPDESPERYTTLDVIRLDSMGKTTLHAAFYDLGPERGYFLAGIERP